ncbi:MAG: CHAT domain-containing tetratricopeptide repeat protein [Cyanobacteria bacterium P01_E01_bin.6]
MYQAGLYAEAVPIAEQALTVREEALGLNHLLTATSLNNLASLHLSLGHYEEAEPLFQTALTVTMQILGLDHPKTATNFNNLANLYLSQGRYEEAEPLFQRALAVTEQALSPNHPHTAQSLNNLANLYLSQSRYEEAEPLFQRALAIREAVLGSDDRMTTSSLNNLAELYRLQGRYREAEPLFQRALAIAEQALDSNHPYIATYSNDLAELYRLQGRYGEAEPLYQRAQAIYENSLGINHPFTATNLNNLAALYNSQGRYEEAELLFRQVLTIREAVLGINHPDTVSSLNNLAELYRLQGQYEEAESLYQKALSINEQLSRANHPEAALTLNNLAELYRLQGQYEEAESLYQRALTITEQTFGVRHPNTALILNNLALLHSLQRHYEEAESLYQTALSIHIQTLGLEHPNVALSLNNLAEMYHVQGQFQLTLSYLRRGLTVEETVLSRNLVGGSDADKRDYLRTMIGTTNAVVSLHLNDLNTDFEATHLALTTLLQRKGRILDIFTNLRAELSNTPLALSLLDELSATVTQLSNLTLNPFVDASVDSYRTQLEDLQARVGTLEDRLSRLSTDFANLTASPALPEIQEALPQSTALVEFTRYKPFNLTASAQGQFGSDRYAAYILQPNGTIQGLDLGAAEDIDTAARALSKSLASSETPLFQVKEEAQALESLVIAPVLNVLGNITTLFLSPDGALNLIPFEALVDESGNYLVETYQFRYLTSGRDLMRLDNATVASNPALLIGNPSYGRPGELVAQADTRAIDFENRNFPSLPGTQREVDLIASRLVNAQVYTETNATEAVLKQQSQPSILHIATHGFFEPVEETLNPLLQSGLILAGAAAGGQSGPDQDGILTALEVTGMNLRGTHVVLSACETGLGELAAGEGVYGLRRALVLAGSQSQVISLWKVDDTATQELMVEYYDRLLSETPRDAALRETQLAFLESEEYSHPYYWAAFIGSGDWRPLQ